MSKHDQRIQQIKESIKTAPLSEEQKSDSMKRIEEWVLEDKAFGTLTNELLEISEYFQLLFSEMGLTK